MGAAVDPYLIIFPPAMHPALPQFNLAHQQYATMNTICQFERCNKIVQQLITCDFKNVSLAQFVEQSSRSILNENPSPYRN